MEFQERAYNVLLVSATEKFNTVISPFLSGASYAQVKTAGNCAMAKRMISERSFDFVIINAPLPDEMGTKFAVDAAVKSSMAVMLLVKSESYEDLLREMTQQGVFMLRKPLSSQILTQALDWMAVARERTRGYEKKTLTLSEKMEEIRKVNRAKWLLITNFGMTEEDAHHLIEHKAMDRCVTRGVIAEEIIKNSGE